MASRAHPSLKTEFPPLPADNHIAHEEVLSGILGPLDAAVEDRPFTMGSNETQRPWYDVRTFLHFMGKQAERIGLVFSRGQPRQSRRRRFLGRRKQSTPSATPRPAASSSNKLRRKEQESRIFDQVHERPEFNAPRDIAGKRLQIPPQTADGENGIPKGRQSVVINNKTQDGTRVQVGQVPLVHSEASKASYSKLPAGDETGFEATTNDGTGVDQMNSSDERVPSSRYALTEPLTRGYSPPQPRDDDDEFTSKAVMVKDSTGKEKAVKLFFDSMSADNWISEPFANAFGFELRPILPRDMKVYRTVCSEEFVPTRYVELQLQDDSLMEDFTTLRCNVTRSMHGIGLIAGRLFMKEHNVVVNPNASRDIFVVTSRKGNDAAQDAKSLLLKQAQEQYEKTKQLSTSTAGPSTQESGASSREPLAPSTTTTTDASSPDVMSDTSKKN